MRYALIIVLGATYYLGWLPADFVVPALLVVSALRVPAPRGGRSPRRGGYIAPASSASGGESLGTAARVATYTDSFRQPGPQSEVRTAFTVPLGGSRTGVPGSYMSEWGFSPGRLTTAAEPPGWYMQAFNQRLKELGDCGCGDTAA